jgi:tRNA pseudouridine38-40 synthase
LQKFAWNREKDGTLVATIQADAFCHNMVRNLVGMCLEVGRGKLDPAEAVKLREAKARTSKFPVLPPQGLTLVEVGYPRSKDLAKRASTTRAKREPV